METLKPLTDFFAAIEQDGRISITHIGIYAALLQFRKANGDVNPVRVYSHKVMDLAKVSAATTYRKCVRELSAYGYIRYVPSFNRKQGSKIYFPELSYPGSNSAWDHKKKK